MRNPERKWPTGWQKYEVVELQILQVPENQIVIIGTVLNLLPVKG